MSRGGGLELSTGAQLPAKTQLPGKTQFPAKTQSPPKTLFPAKTQLPANTLPLLYAGQLMQMAISVLLLNMIAAFPCLRHLCECLQQNAFFSFEGERSRI